MRSKLFEVRDRMTFIPVIAVSMLPQTDVPVFEAELYLLRRAGYGLDSECVLLVRLVGGKACHDPHDWGNDTRTMPVAHEWIEKHFHEMTSGDVVDVEYILHETTAPKKSEREPWVERDRTEEGGT